MKFGPKILVGFCFVLSFFWLQSFQIVSAWENLTGGDHGGADWTISTNTAVAGVHTNVGSFTVGPSATVTVQAYDGGSNPTYGSFEVNASSITIQGTLTAASSGYRGVAAGSGSGPGASLYVNGSNASGASHGGFGGRGGNPPTSGGRVYYGSILTPVAMGSSGGASYNGQTGGHGGGAIKLTATGTINLTGSISANGGIESSYQHAGGGAGGSILIIGSDMSGGGSITANGGSNSGSGGGGGGGRIAIKYSGSNTLSGTITANGGNGGGGGSENGTVIYLDTTNNDLEIKRGQIWKSDSESGGSDYNFRNVTVSNNATWSLKGYYTDNNNGVGFNFNVANFSLCAGCIIQTYGYEGLAGAAGTGPGGGGYQNGVNPGGGGYGGIGQTGSSGRPGGPTYGSSTAPVHLGSSGGGNYNNSVAGATGGGAIKIDASETVTITGTLSSNGSNATSHNGGGSGGSIYIIADTITGGGVLRANGGTSGGGNGGGGGGGRISLLYSTELSLSLTPSVSKGTGGSGGADGTYVTSGFPQNASGLSQYKSDGTTEITSGSVTDETISVLKITMAAGTNSTLTPEFEIRDIDTALTDVATNTGSSVSYTGTPVTGQATISGLSDATNYHWQARVCDQSDNCSDWVQAGGDPYDFRVFTNQTPSNPSSLGQIDLVSGSSVNDTTPTLTFTQSDSDEANEVYYTIEVSAESDYDPALIEYVSALGAQGSNSFTVGQPLNGGVYLAGSIGQTLTNGTYYWRVKTTDENGASSDWVTANTDDPAFSVDSSAPISNASSLAFSNAGDGDWSNLKPRFIWTAGQDDVEGSILGYCVSLSETTIGGEIPADNPQSAAGILEGLNDGVTSTACPYIVSGTELDLETISGLNLTSNRHYYISILALDNAGNTYAGSTSDYQNLLSFKYDSTAPTNVTSISAAGGSFSNINDMYFSWPTSGGSIASDAESGLLGYQYSINDQTNWHGTETDPNTGLSIVPVAAETPLNLENSRDGSYIAVGDNTIYFRSVDIAGNTSSPSTYRTASVAYGGEAPAFPGDASLTINPNSSEINSFALNWSDAIPSTSRTIETYYYMVNTTPPATLATIQGNSATYIASEDTSVDARSLPGVVRGSNTVYVVVTDDLSNYSPSNNLSATFTLDTDNPDSPKNLSVSDASIKAVSLWRASLAWETPDYSGLGDLTYSVQRSSDGENWSTVGHTNGNAYVDTVSTSSNFYWRVGSTDSSDASIASPSYSNAVSLTPKGSYTSAADLTSGPVVTDITTKKAKISWTTSRESDSKIAYGTESEEYFEEEPSNSTSVTDHIINLTNLSPGTKYYYIAKWTDEDGNTGVSSEKSFETTPAPIIKEATVANASIDSAIINFTSLHANKVKIYYGKTSSFGGSKEIETASSESSYSVIMSELEDGTKYFYQLNGFDAEGAEYPGEIHSFETLPRPQVSEIQLQQIADTAETTILVSWQSNTAISSIITVYPSNNPSAARDIVDLNLVSGAHSLIIDSLLPATEYTLVVKGNDKLGNQATSVPQTFTTATDTRPPAIINLKVIGGTIPPVGFAAGTVNAQLVVTWDTDEPATSQIEYGEGTGTSYSQKTAEDGNLTTNHVVVISGLTPSEVYHLRAISVDSANNDSRSVDTVTIAPKATRSALDLVITSLGQIFGSLSKLIN